MFTSLSAFTIQKAQPTVLLAYIQGRKISLVFALLSFLLGAMPHITKTFRNALLYILILMQTLFSLKAELSN